MPSMHQVRVTHAEPFEDSAFLGLFHINRSDQEIAQRGDSLLQSVRAHEVDRWSHPVAWRNGSVVVRWRDSEFDRPGFTRYEPRDDRGVRLGGCAKHGPDECWRMDDFPLQAEYRAPAGVPEAGHVTFGPLSRVVGHAGCPWATARVDELVDREPIPLVGAGVCCRRSGALPAGEQSLLQWAAFDMSTYVKPKRVLSVLDVLIGWRLFGLYSDSLDWPGLGNGSTGLSSTVRSGWFTMLQLRELA